MVASIIDTGIKNSDAVFIWQRCGLLVLLAVIGLTCSLTAQYFSARAALGFGTALRKDLFRHIDTLSYSELDGIGTPTLVTRMTSDINQVQNGVNLTLRLLLRSPFIVVGALIMAFSISPRLTFLFLAATAIISLIIWLIMRATVPIYHQAQNGLDRVTLLTRENYVGARVVRAFARQADELAAFVARLNRLYVLEETEPATEAESEMYDDFGDYGDFGDFGDFGDTGETYTAEELKLAIEEQKRDIGQPDCAQHHGRHCEVRRHSGRFCGGRGLYRDYRGSRHVCPGQPE